MYTYLVLVIADCFVILCLKRFSGKTPSVMADEQVGELDGEQQFLQGPWLEMLKDLDMDGE